MKFFRRISTRAWAGIQSARKERGAVSGIAHASPGASVLWLPYSYFILILVAFFPQILGIWPEYSQALASIMPSGLGPFVAPALIYGVLSATAWLGISLVSRGDGRSRISRWIRASLFFLALPGRLWAYALLGLVGLILGHPFWSTTVMIGLFIVYALTNGFREANIPRMVFEIVAATGLVFVVVGGRAWGNQFGGGTTGGTPLGCIFSLALGIMGLWGAGSVLLLAVGALTIPGFLSTIIFNVSPQLNAFRNRQAWVGVVAWLIVGLVPLLPPALNDARLLRRTKLITAVDSP